MLVMPNSLHELYFKIENLRGKNLVIFIIPLLLSGVLLGIIMGNFMPQLLKSDEEYSNVIISDIPPKERSQFEGRVVYVDPRMYPMDKISYVLEDSSGKEIILLSAKDQKLTVVEGLNVVVFGDVEKSKDGKNDVLQVERVLVRNK